MAVYHAFVVLLLVGASTCQNTWSQYTVQPRFSLLEADNTQTARHEHSAVLYNFLERFDNDRTPLQTPTRETDHFLTFGGRSELEGAPVTLLEDYEFNEGNNNNAQYYRLNSTGGEGMPGFAGHTITNAGNNLLLLFGGDNNGTSELWALDVSTHPYVWFQPVTVGSPPSARHGHTAVFIDTKLYIFGGTDDTPSGFFNDLYSYDVITRTWTYILPANAGPTARYGHAAASFVNQGFYIFGGFDYTGSLKNDVWYFHLANNSWVEQTINLTISFPPTPRMDHSAVMARAQRYLVVFGGLDGEYRNDVWLFDTVCRNWMLQDTNGNPPSRRGGHSAVMHDDHRMIVFGGRGLTTTTNTMYRYTVIDAPPPGERCPEIGVNSVYNSAPAVSAPCFVAALVFVLALFF